MSTLTLGGSTLASKSGSVLSLDSGVTFPAGKVINVDVIFNRTRTTVSSISAGTTDAELFNVGNYNKQESSSNLIVHVFAPTYYAISGNGNIGLKVGSSSTQWCGIYTYTGGGTYSVGISAHAKITGLSATGNQAISLRYGNATGASHGFQPCSYINAHNGNDNRLFADGSQPGTTATVFEVMT